MLAVVYTVQLCDVWRIERIKLNGHVKSLRTKTREKEFSRQTMGIITVTRTDRSIMICVKICQTQAIDWSHHMFICGH